jgi:2'-5' RNA ligase
MWKTIREGIAKNISNFEMAMSHSKNRFMENMIQFPGTRFNEYQVVLSPHEELWNRMNRLKEEFADQFSAPQARYTRPHMALLRFHQYEAAEERILQRLHTIAMGIAPFKVELKDFGSYPSHTIFFQVPTRLPVEKLVSELKQTQQLLRVNKEYKPHFLDDPHINLCLKLLPWQYEQAWKEYSHRHFTGRFIAGSMMVLSRRAGEKKNWRIAGKFDFLNLPVVTKQGSLFA